jgi:two-component system, NarL family, nitrate/nitrite response regulator NarL
MMRLVLCDDQRILVESLAVALQARGHDVLAAATTPEECMRAVAKAHPDVCLLDLYLPGREDGLEAARAIRKDQSLDKIAAALLQVATGGFVFQTDLVRDVVRHLTAQPRKEPWDYLTVRELEVLRRIVAGESTKQMARSMQIAASTVRTYSQNVLTKLGAHSRLEASAIAVRARLTDEVPHDACSPT